MNSKMICLDTETTGVNPKRDEVLTLSIVDGEGDILFDRMFKPTRVEAWPYASRVNGIYPEDVAGCGGIGESIAEIDAILDGAERIIGYNLGFDLGFLQAAGVCIPEQNAQLVDVMPDFARLYGEWNPKRGKYRWQKLTKAAEFIGYEWEGTAHSAAADARATLAVHRWCLDVHDKIAALSLRLDELLNEEFGRLPETQQKVIKRALAARL